MPGLAELLNHQSGLLGVAGISDMRVLLERTDTDPDAAMAVQMFCYQVRKQIGALSAALSALDLLVFTGGIGERAAPVRWEACSGLEHLGVRLDREGRSPSCKTPLGRAGCYGALIYRCFSTRSERTTSNPRRALQSVVNG